MKLRIKKEIDMKIFIFEKWNPNLAFTKSGPFFNHFSPFWHCAWQEKCIFPPFF